MNWKVWKSRSIGTILWNGDLNVPKHIDVKKYRWFFILVNSYLYFNQRIPVRNLLGIVTLKHKYELKSKKKQGYKKNPMKWRSECIKTYTCEKVEVQQSKGWRFSIHTRTKRLFRGEAWINHFEEIGLNSIHLCENDSEIFFGNCFSKVQVWIWKVWKKQV